MRAYFLPSPSLSFTMRIFRTLMMAGMGYAAYKGYQKYKGQLRPMGSTGTLDPRI